MNIDVKKIRRIMRSKGLFLKDLARMTNVPYKTLLWNFKNPNKMKVQLLCAICKALDINISDVLEGSEK